MQLRHSSITRHRSEITYSSILLITVERILSSLLNSQQDILIRTFLRRPNIIVVTLIVHRQQPAVFGIEYKQQTV